MLDLAEASHHILARAQQQTVIVSVCVSLY